MKDIMSSRNNNTPNRSLNGHTRNPYVSLAKLKGTKGGAMKDRRKEDNRRQCRVR
jgi:hypothetical protein